MRRGLYILLRRFARNQRGTTMVEFAISVSLFLLIFFAVLDFGRLAYNWVMAEKAMERAARIAAVRCPICPSVPNLIARSDRTDGTFPMGTPCRNVADLCFQYLPQSCTLATPNENSSLSQEAAAEIWTTIRPMLPDNATPANVLMTYTSDPQLGVVGGPYTPMITAELTGAAGSDGTFGDFQFTFVTPLSALAAAAGASNTTGVPGEGASIPFPDISVTIPSEDLNVGGRG